MMKYLNITKILAVSFLAISIAAGTALAAEPKTGVACGAYETNGQYVTVSPFQCQNSDDTQINQYKNMRASETITIAVLHDNSSVKD